jgi:hypothetical protein
VTVATILAGRVGDEERAARASAALAAAGHSGDSIQVFYVNPPGQHARHPLGGDHDADPGAPRASGQAEGAAVGAVVGVVAGVAAAAVAPLAAPAVIAGLTGVGAHAGGLAGAMRDADDGPNDPTPVRRGGLMIAVRVAPDAVADTAAILRTHGVEALERAEGDWRDGDWTDFDPLMPPLLLDDCPERAATDAATAPEVGPRSGTPREA